MLCPISSFFPNVCMCINISNKIHNALIEDRYIYQIQNRPTGVPYHTIYMVSTFQTYIIICFKMAEYSHEILTWL